MALVIPTSGEPYAITPADGRVFRLTELQTIVGGYLEALRLPADAHGRIMYLNEDGKRLALPVNRRATLLVRPQLHPADVIVGTVILCTLAETGDDPEADDARELEEV